MLKGNDLRNYEPLDWCREHGMWECTNPHPYEGEPMYEDEDYTLEDEYEPECLQSHTGACEGRVEYRPSLSGTGTAIPRCQKHWFSRLDEQDAINERYPAMQPADFDPSYAGERWDDEY